MLKHTEKENVNWQGLRTTRKCERLTCVDGGKSKVERTRIGRLPIMSPGENPKLRTNDMTSIFGGVTALRINNTRKCCEHKDIGARYVDVKALIDGGTLTTVTRRNSYEDFCVVGVMGSLDGSKNTAEKLPNMESLLDSLMVM